MEDSALWPVTRTMQRASCQTLSSLDTGVARMQWYVYPASLKISALQFKRLFYQQLLWHTRPYHCHGNFLMAFATDYLILDEILKCQACRFLMDITHHLVFHTFSPLQSIIRISNFSKNSTSKDLTWFHDDFYGITYQKFLTKQSW